MGKKRLVAEGNFAAGITYQLEGDSTVLVGSPAIQGDVMQYGAEKGSLGGGAPWGDIPARTWLGLSAEDGRTILGLVESYLGG